MSTEETGFDKIHFMVEHPNSTKATATSFVPNDAISLFAVEYVDGQKAPLQKADNFINNERISYDGNNWVPEHNLYWSGSPCDFYAVYPYQKLFPSIENYIFKLKLDQNNGGFEASDFMYAYAENAARASGAVLVPQNLEKKTPLVEITMGGIAYLLEYSLSLRAGCVHTITVTLNTSPDQEMIEISIDPTQGDWN